MPVRHRRKRNALKIKPSRMVCRFLPVLGDTIETTPAGVVAVVYDVEMRCHILRPSSFQEMAEAVR